MRNILIALSTILVLCSPAVYIYSIVRGETRPHRTTRFVLLVICVLSTWALIDGGYGSAFWLSAASTVQALLVFALCFKWGYGGWEKLDLVCLAIASVGVVVWQTSGNPLYGLFAAIIADVVGIIPTLVKTYRFPKTENWQFFAIDTVAGIISLFALTSTSLYAASYPVYIVVINGVMVALIVTRKRALAEAKNE